jgi:hypothetical protein
MNPPISRRQFLKKFLILSGSGLFLRASKASQDIKPFGYYQGLGPNEKRDPKRKDGTYYQMPVITAAEIDEGTEREYIFWHGHSGQKHRFVVNEEDFIQIQNGVTIELYTNVVDGHRHCLRIGEESMF